MLIARGYQSWPSAYARASLPLNAHDVRARGGRNQILTVKAPLFSPLSMLQLSVQRGGDLLHLVLEADLVEPELICVVCGQLVHLILEI